jgi:hypothetical protein
MLHCLMGKLIGHNVRFGKTEQIVLRPSGQLQLVPLLEILLRLLMPFLSDQPLHSRDLSFRRVPVGVLPISRRWRAHALEKVVWKRRTSIG